MTAKGTAKRRQIKGVRTDSSKMALAKECQQGRRQEGRGGQHLGPVGPESRGRGRLRVVSEK